MGKLQRLKLKRLINNYLISVASGHQVELGADGFIIQSLQHQAPLLSHPKPKYLLHENLVTVYLLSLTPVLLAHSICAILQLD